MGLFIIITLCVSLLKFVDEVSIILINILYQLVGFGVVSFLESICEEDGYSQIQDATT